MDIEEAILFEDISADRVLIGDCRIFYSNIYSLKDFSDYSNCQVFVYLFGEDEGERLWMCFVEDAHRDIYKLLFEYLNNEQQFVLIANILKNRDLKLAAL